MVSPQAARVKATLAAGFAYQLTDGPRKAELTEIRM